MPSSPPTFGYTTANVFPTLTFTNPTTIGSAPGETNRLFVVEKRGRIVVITNLAAPTRTIFMDLSASVITSAGDNGAGVGEERGLLGMAFHPGYATNGYFYVWYTGNGPAYGTNDILARYKVSSTNANVADVNSETRFIVQADRDENHNGGHLHFGPDGFLYVSLGDEGGGYGNWGNCQKIDQNFFAAIMRIDVDNRPGNLPPNSHAALPELTNYSIPADNPFVGATNFNGLPVNPTNVRTEFWAVGMHNPCNKHLDDN